ncbi:hypothetical protein C1645_818576 [Glomus cerebriforme]|uniref:Uncharacterized protein n=1 Tax=Glomus cerebriforme TaxID=658196 RepID=A0A397TGU9_9GLOM|nr:hypothetical protein C1645_818576 [Glomus cerebriforme]
MEKSFNCYVLLNNTSNTIMVDLNSIANSVSMKLWKVNVKKRDIKDNNIFTEYEVIRKLDEKGMNLKCCFNEYFQAELDNTTQFIAIST